MTEIVLAICFAIWTIAFGHIIKRIVFCGSYYIEFDMRRYHLYRRGFLQDYWYCAADDEITARRMVPQARSNPPRKIWFV
jgi:hypothetical protein